MEPVADRLDAQATRLEAEAAALRAEARQLREAPGDDTLMSKDWPSDIAVSFRTVRDAARRGEIEGVKAGRHVVFKRSAVEAWLARRRLPAAAPGPVEAVAPRSDAGWKAMAEAGYAKAVGR